MMKKLLPTLLLAALFATACHRSDTLLDEAHTFGNHIWNRYTPEQFTAHIDNADDFYHLEMSVTVDTTLFRYDLFPLIVKMQSSEGEQRTFRTDINLKQNAHWMGEVVSDGRRVGRRVRSYFSFNRQGDYHIDVYQATSQYDLEGVAAVSLNITRADLGSEL